MSQEIYPDETYQSPRKVAKSEESEENITNEEKSKSVENIDYASIKKRIDLTLQNNPFLSQKLADLQKSVHHRKPYSHSEEREISKRQEINTTRNLKSNSESSQPPRSTTEHIPQWSGGQFAHPSPGSGLTDEQKAQDLISKLILLNQTPQTPLANVISPDIQVLIQSLVMQDLFTSAFKRYLHSSKGRISQNLSDTISHNMPRPPARSLDSLRRHPESKRKNTDPMTSETIESDIQHQMTSQGARNTPVVPRVQAPLSAFFPQVKSRSMSMNTGSQKAEGFQWGHKEEKKH